MTGSRQQPEQSEQQAGYRYNFTSVPKDGYVPVPYHRENGAVRYEDTGSYGFVEQTGTLPPRRVNRAQITAAYGGFEISEPEAESGTEVQSGEIGSHGSGGMAFRVKLPRGAYKVQVTLSSAPEDTIIAVSGMNADALSQAEYWDAARLVPNLTRPQTQGKIWSYDYVSGREYLDIELEPRRPGVTVGIAELVLMPVGRKHRTAAELPVIFTLGDSTVKSYVFEEAPMSGWGQVFGRLFDRKMVQVVNYSQGGRSFKSAHNEGRFNDILLTGRAGDYLLIQFGHNDESEDEEQRFGRGSTEEMYRTYVEEIYIPAVRERGMIPVLLTPMSRTDGAAQPGHVYMDSFAERKFPVILRELAGKLGVPLIDLNKASLEYYNELGVEAVTAIFMSVEAGETPGKTNDGSYAGGHPSSKNDGTHYKEALSKQFARMVVTLIAELGKEGDADAARIAGMLKPTVHAAIRSQDWSAVYPEITPDIVSGPGAYYRNQIEKLIQLGVLGTDEEGRFNPEGLITVGESAAALGKVMKLDPAVLADYTSVAGADALTREVMGVMLWDAYQADFTGKPRFMTDYNGDALGPDEPGYDPYLPPEQRGIMYYPLVSFEQLTDTDQVDPELLPKIEAAYKRGLFRAEKGIRRGELSYADALEPKLPVTRAKAAKALYYMWVLIHPVNVENHVLL